MSNEDKFKTLIQPILDFDFKKAKEEREALAKAKREEDMKVFLAGPDLESTLRCARYAECGCMRWKVPTTESVLCREHTLEVLRGERRAPPLRARIDYHTPARRTFLVEDLSALTPEKDTPGATK